MNRQIQNYYIENLIREEAMGIVYLATDLSSNKQVTLRLLHPLVKNQVLLKNHDLLVSLNHPGIAKFYSCFQEAGQLYLVAEHVSGVTLSAHLATPDRQFTEEKIWELLMQITDAFDYAHQKGVNHFTIHPDKILITAEEQVKVLDFGIASLLGSHLDKEGIALNKVQYRSPEQIQGKMLDARSDIYALGVIFFELLTRQSPYPDLLSEWDIKHKIISHTLPPIQLYTAAFTHNYSMQGIIDTATAKNPAYRFKNFQELKQSLLEEKDERETLFISHLMQEVNKRSQPNALEQFSAIDLAKKMRRRKHVGYALMGVALMAGAITIGLNIPVASHEGMIGLNKEAKKGNSIEKEVKDKHKDTTTSDESNKIIPSPGAENKVSTESSKEHSGDNYSKAAPKQERGESTIARAGFSLETNAEKSFSRLHLQNRLENFYAVLQAKDLSQANDFYAPTVNRFFNEDNVKEAQLKHLLTKAWKRTPEDKHEILWDTFQFQQDEQGNYRMEFYMNYIYRRSNRKAWRSRKIYTLIKMDKDLKIYHMSGD